MSFREIPHVANAGKVTILTVLACFSLFTLFYFVAGTPQTERANAQVAATTSVTVLNTPPLWTVDAQEAPGSSIASPTNAGDSVSWTATGTDSNNDDYFLIICKTDDLPEAVNNAPPFCGGGLPSAYGATTTWAISATTTSATQAVAATTTADSWDEENDWYAWICDANLFLARCNNVHKQGDGATASPFVVNHRPSFTLFEDDSPTLPGAVVTFTATASDPDSYGGQDSVRIFICRANDFSTSTQACGPGGTWATSTLYLSGPTASTTIPIPTQSGSVAAYGFVVDEHGFAASGGAQGTEPSPGLYIANATPTISAAQVFLNDTDGVGPLTLLYPAAETDGFYVDFTITDNNSCVANASTTAEIVNARISVYRSGVTQSNCQTSGHYDPTNCYPYGVDTSTWEPVCAPVSGTCDGPDDPDVTWRCTFPLWYVADPTDGDDASDSPWFDQDWRASVQAIDKDFATSTLVESSSGNNMVSFLMYSVNTMSIAYGSLEPDQQTDPIVQTTTLSATGNVGLDKRLYGLDMCTTFPTCTGNSTSTIAVSEQVYATSSVSYAGATALGANPGVILDLNVPKSTSTVTQASRDTFWGIRIPDTITLAGDYTGQNTLIGVTGEAENW
jgi:hypothetical protein